MRMPAPRFPEQVKAVPPSQPSPPWLPTAGGSVPATHCLPVLVRLRVPAYYLIVPQCGARHPTGDQRRSLSAAAVGNRSFARKRLLVFTTSHPARAMFSGLPRLRTNPSVGESCTVSATEADMDWHGRVATRHLRDRIGCCLLDSRAHYRARFTNALVIRSPAGSVYLPSKGTGACLSPQRAYLRR
jgi:hypothetical protein